MHPRTFNPKNADKSYAFGVRIEATICRHTSGYKKLPFHSCWAHS